MATMVVIFYFPLVYDFVDTQKALKTYQVFSVTLT